eukprot:1183624-Prorocentrum_minimum.AAC.3
MFEVAHKEATRAGGADAEVALVETLKGADLAMMFEVARVASASLNPEVWVINRDRVTGPVTACHGVVREGREVGVENALVKEMQGRAKRREDLSLMLGGV